MTKEKLLEFYNTHTANAKEVIRIFEDQFGADKVDSTLVPFEDFYERIQDLKLSDLPSSNSESFTILGVRHNSDTLVKDLTDTKFDAIHHHILHWLSKLNINTINREENDWCDIYIYVWFPKVKITNEKDKSTEVEDLYVRVPIKYNGTIAYNFEMIITTLTVNQVKADYMHSHLPGIVSDFEQPCLGSGPIRETQNTLKARYDTNIWGLFTYELSKYVTVESEKGVPYRHLSYIGGSSTNYAILDNDEYTDIFESYVTTVRKLSKALIDNQDIKFAFKNGRITLGEPVRETIMKINKEYNKLAKRYYIPEYFYSTRRLIGTEGNRWREYNGSDNSRTDWFQGRHIFVFKGKEVITKIKDSIDENIEIKRMLPTYVYQRVISMILITANQFYGKENNDERKYQII